MYPYQPIPMPFRNDYAQPIGETRFLPFFGFPFLAGIAGGLLGGALAFGPRPYYPYPPYPQPYPCGPAPCAPYYY